MPLNHDIVYDGVQSRRDPVVLVLGEDYSSPVPTASKGFQDIRHVVLLVTQCAYRADIASYLDCCIGTGACKCRRDGHDCQKALEQTHVVVVFRFCRQAGPLQLVCNAFCFASESHFIYLIYVPASPVLRHDISPSVYCPNDLLSKSFELAHFGNLCTETCRLVDHCMEECLVSLRFPHTENPWTAGKVWS